MPLILPRYGGAPIHTDYTRAELVGIGSLIQFLPSGFAGDLWGMGLMSDSHEETLNGNVRVRALRGHLTAQAVFGHTPADLLLGDPGLLVSRVIKRCSPRFTVGIIPHYHHHNEPFVTNLARRLEDRSVVIDVTRSPRRVIKLISACDLVVTTSLHGLVTADSYGIPAVWSSPPPDIGGGEFKFHDYESIFPEPLDRRIDHPDDIGSFPALMSKAATPSRAFVEDRIDLLETSLTDLLLERGDSVPAGTFAFRELARLARRKEWN